MRICRMSILSISCHFFLIIAIIGESIGINSGISTSSGSEKSSINGPREISSEKNVGESLEYLLTNHHERPDDGSPGTKTSQSTSLRDNNQRMLPLGERFVKIKRSADVSADAASISQSNVDVAGSGNPSSTSGASSSSASTSSETDVVIEFKTHSDSAAAAKSLAKSNGPASKPVQVNSESTSAAKSSASSRTNGERNRGRQRPRDRVISDGYGDSDREYDHSGPRRNHRYPSRHEDDDRRRPGDHGDYDSNPDSDYDFDYDEDERRRPTANSGYHVSANSGSYSSSSTNGQNSRAGSSSSASAFANSQVNVDRSYGSSRNRRPNRQRGERKGSSSSGSSASSSYSASEIGIKFDDNLNGRIGDRCRNRPRGQCKQEDCCNEELSLRSADDHLGACCQVGSSTDSLHANSRGSLLANSNFQEAGSGLTVSRNHQCHLNPPKSQPDCVEYGECGCNRPVPFGCDSTFRTSIASDSSLSLCDKCREVLQSRSVNICPTCGAVECSRRKRSILDDGRIHHFDSLNPTSNDSSMIQDINEDVHFFDSGTNYTEGNFFSSPILKNSDIHLEIESGPPVPLQYVNKQLSDGRNLAEDLQNRGKELAANGILPKPHTASMLHFLNDRASEKSIGLNEASKSALFGTKLLQESLSTEYNFTSNTFTSFLNEHGFHVTGKRIRRRHSRECDAYKKYRSLDGSCNNLRHPTWGQSNTAFRRILPARYSDDVYALAVSVIGEDLPNPRDLSVELFTRGNSSNSKLTLLVMQWGQILAHDLGRQVTDQTGDGGIECCAEGGGSILPENLQHHSCAPISISPTDKFYSAHGQQCMNFVRSMTVPSEDGSLSPAKQLNGATSYLDLSHIYGPDKSASDKLREFRGGRLKIQFRNGQWFLPTITNNSQSICDAMSTDDICYESGDQRTNQNPQLVILQTLLVRKHNRLSNGLSELNPHWSDEKLFQEARRILIAEYQHITYNAWLPLILGTKYCTKYGLVRSRNSEAAGYNSSVNPSTISAFTSGSFRFLHSIIDGDINLYDHRQRIIGKTRLSNHYFRPKILEDGNNFDYLLQGLTSQPIHAPGTNLHREITEKLFRSKNEFGMDLVALDIQRGRDHGLPGYNAYRKICRLKIANDFDDLSDEISRENIEKLRIAYAHVDDIDLVVGASMETRKSGSLLGSTNRCITAEQFYRSRVGDRYFYDHQDSDSSFTPDQLKEIKKSSLSRFLCEVGGPISSIQRKAFKSKSLTNPFIKCTEFPIFDLQPWKD